MRVFVAIDISDIKVRESIQNIQNSLQIKARAVEPQNMHFTLQFLGEISQDMLKKVKHALAKIVFSSFNLQITGIGAFPHSKNPRIIWAGTDTKSACMLVNLVKQIEGLLRPLGFRQNGTFRPHITIFRIKSATGDIIDRLEEFKEYEFGMITVLEIKLKQSRLTLSGPVYSDLGVIKAH